MNRNDFLKNSAGFLGMALVAPSLLKSASKNPINLPFSADCKATVKETAGPFPTKSPTQYERVNIKEDRTGVPMVANITIGNLNANCMPLSGAIVDVWHCDKDGNYSQYGSSAGDSFLRGRQITNRSGLVSFETIFPGWYRGRATHIHMHIYDAEGKSLLVTQIAFPEGNNSEKELVNNSAGYKGMNGYTYNNKDGVFRDGVETEMCTLKGSVKEGYVLDFTAYVSGPVLSVDKFNHNKFELGQNFPNPFTSKTTIPITLKSTSKVTVSVFDLLGRIVNTPIKDKTCYSGVNNLEIKRDNLRSGYYIYKVTIENDSGTYHQSLKMLLN